MAKVGAQRAAVLTGKSKSTIQRAMNSGKLSYELDRNKRRVIDVSELERVFGLQKQSMQEDAAPVAKTAGGSTDDAVAAAVEKEHMSMQIKMLEQQLYTAQERIDDLADQRDKWEKQASQVLLTSQYTQKQAEELRAQIKEREERARQRRLQNVHLNNAQKSSAPSGEAAAKKNSEFGKPSGQNAKAIDEKMKSLRAGNENATEEPVGSVFRFWKRAKG